MIYYWARSFQTCPVFLFAGIVLDPSWPGRALLLFVLRSQLCFQWVLLGMNLFSLQNVINSVVNLVILFGFSADKEVFDEAPVVKVSSNKENCLKFFAIFFSEVQLMTYSQKVSGRKKFGSWRIIVENFFSRIFPQVWQPKISYDFPVITIFKVKKS